MAEALAGKVFSFDLDGVTANTLPDMLPGMTSFIERADFEGYDPALYSDDFWTMDEAHGLDMGESFDAYIRWSEAGGVLQLPPIASTVLGIELIAQEGGVSVANTSRYRAIAGEQTALWVPDKTNGLIKDIYHASDLEHRQGKVSVCEGIEAVAHFDDRASTCEAIVAAGMRAYLVKATPETRKIPIPDDMSRDVVVVEDVREAIDMEICLAS